MSTPRDKAVPSQTANMKLEAFLKAFETDHMMPFTNPGHSPRTRDVAEFSPEAAKTRGGILRNLLEMSPDLKQRMQNAFNLGLIEKIEYLPQKTFSGGDYSRVDKSMRLPLFSLDDDYMLGNDPHTLIFAMGHEVQHALNAPNTDKSLADVSARAKLIARSSDASHDYTSAVAEVIRIRRMDEASAHIGGFNALVSKMLKDKPEATPTLKELYNALPWRMEDFIIRTGTSPNFSFELKSGLTVERNTMMPYSENNIVAMGQYYFDKPPNATGLGPHGNQDYKHNYGDAMLNFLIDIETKMRKEQKKDGPMDVAPAITIDLKQLGLSRSLLTSKLVFIDAAPVKSPHDPSIATTDTEGSSKKPRIQPQGETSSADGPTAKPSGLYAQSLHAIDPPGANPFGLHDRTEKENVAAAMALRALKDGMRAIDGVINSPQGGQIAYEGDPNMGSSKRFVFDVQQAKTKPSAESLKEFGELLQKADPVSLPREPPPQR